MYGWMDGWLIGWMDRWVVGWLDGWMDGWMSGWVGGWMDEWKDDNRDDAIVTEHSAHLQRQPRRMAAVDGRKGRADLLQNRHFLAHAAQPPSRCWRRQHDGGCGARFRSVFIFHSHSRLCSRFFRSRGAHPGFRKFGGRKKGGRRKKDGKIVDETQGGEEGVRGDCVLLGKDVLSAEGRK